MQLWGPCIQDAKLGETGFSDTMSLIQGKYKMFILYALAGCGVVRFNELKKYINTISYKTRSSTLKELEQDGLIRREEYPQIPPKVEYSLTERGRSLSRSWTGCATGASGTVYRGRKSAPEAAADPWGDELERVREGYRTREPSTLPNPAEEENDHQSYQKENMYAVIMLS